MPSGPWSSWARARGARWRRSRSPPGPGSPPAISPRCSRPWAGLVEAQRGLRGGFVLARSLDELTILDVINAVDSRKRIDRCPLGLAAQGRRLCPLHRRLDQGMAQLEALFGGTTIGQLLAEQDPSPPLCEMVAHGTSCTRS